MVSNAFIRNSFYTLHFYTELLNFNNDGGLFGGNALEQLCVTFTNDLANLNRLKVTRKAIANGVMH